MPLFKTKELEVNPMAEPYKIKIKLNKKSTRINEQHPVNRYKQALL
jgi:hypothetical protein